MDSHISTILFHDIIFFFILNWTKINEQFLCTFFFFYKISNKKVLKIFIRKKIRQFSTCISNLKKFKINGIVYFYLVSFTLHFSPGLSLSNSYLVHLTTVSFLFLWMFRTNRTKHVI